MTRPWRRCVAAPVLALPGLPALLSLLASLALGGCANLGVQPWEKDVLAGRDMRLDLDLVDLELDDHIYFSKEASSGGRSFGGGGCGCN